MNTTLHIPVDKQTKEKAEILVKAQGYSSLQEIFRVFLSSLARGEIKPAFINADIVETLTASQELYLDKREKETKKAIKEGKAHVAHTAQEMIKVLENTSSER